MIKITFETLKQLFETSNYFVVDTINVSGGFTKEFLDSLEFKFEAFGESTEKQHPSIFLGKDQGLWFLEIDETRMFWNANIEDMDTLKILFTVFNVLK